MASAWFTRFGLAAAGLSLAAATAIPCCGIGPLGRTVGFGPQTNIVVWDAERKIQHFVRDARFASDATDFGFLAPSPTQPTLHEAKWEAFYALQGLAPRPGLSCSGGPEPTAAAAGSVNVLEEKDVAGYRTAVIKATDADKLGQWLKKNGYGWTPDTREWLDHYIKKQWIITAFKVLGDGSSAGTGLVRMTFPTSVPFNPYLVPRSNRLAEGGLQLYFVSSARVTATVGESGGRPWEVEETWSARLDGTTRRALALGLDLPEAEIPANARVMAFGDETFPNGAEDDLFFRPAPFNLLASLDDAGVPVHWAIAALLAAAMVPVVLWIKRMSLRRRAKP